MSFLSGKNTGGDKADYYDNPNFNPKDDGKSKGDKLLRKAAEEQAYADSVEANYYEGRSDDYNHLVQTEGEAAYAQGKADEQVKATVSYFRGKDKNRLNPGGAGGKQINPKFSEAASLETKLSKFGFSYDPTAPDTFFEEVYRLPDKAYSQNKTRTFDTSDMISHSGWNQETMQYKKDSPMPKTIAGVNQELQARKARTRDFAMEFRGTVYDYIGEVSKTLRDDIAGEIADSMGKEFQGYEQPLSRKELEDKFFPDEASKKAAKTELMKMIAFTDEISDINRNYSSIHNYAETILRTEYGSRAPFPLGVVNQTTDTGVDDKLTFKNYEKSRKAFSDWKAKKGVPKIVRLISKLG